MGEGGWSENMNAYGSGNTHDPNQYYGYSQNWNANASQQSRFGYPYRPYGMYGYPSWPTPPWAMAQNMAWGFPAPGQSGMGMGVRGASNVPGMNADWNTRMVGWMGEQRGESNLNLDGNQQNDGRMNENTCCEPELQESCNQNDGLGGKTKKSDRSVSFENKALAVTIEGGEVEEVEEGEESEEGGRKEETEEERANTAVRADGGETTTPSPSSCTSSDNAGENPTTTITQQANTHEILANSDPQQPKPNQVGPNRPIRPENTANNERAELANSQASLQADTSLASSVNNAKQVASRQSVDLEESCGNGNSADGKKGKDEQTTHSQSDFSQSSALPTDFVAREESGGKGKGRDSLAKSGSARLSMGGKGDTARSIASKLGMMRIEGKGVGGVGGDKQGKQKKEGVMKLRSQSQSQGIKK